MTYDEFSVDRALSGQEQYEQIQDHRLSHTSSHPRCRFRAAPTKGRNTHRSQLSFPENAAGDDPGREFGMMRQPGHRFFYSPEEVEPVNEGEFV
jgi:hypothetical protein